MLVSTRRIQSVLTALFGAVLAAGLSGCGYSYVDTGSDVKHIKPAFIYQGPPMPREQIASIERDVEFCANTVAGTLNIGRDNLMALLIGGVAGATGGSIAGLVLQPTNYGKFVLYIASLVAGENLIFDMVRRRAWAFHELERCMDRKRTDVTIIAGPP